MAFEDFILETRPDGSQTISGPGLRAFELSHRDRCHFQGDPGDRPAIIVLNRPFKLSLVPNRDVYHLVPVKLRELTGWPPVWGGVYSGADRFPMPGEGVIVGGSVDRPARSEDPPYLSISGSFDGNAVSSALGGYPESMIKCIANTLNSLRGRAVRNVTDAELLAG